MSRLSSSRVCRPLSRAAFGFAIIALSWTLACTPAPPDAKQPKVADKPRPPPQTSSQYPQVASAAKKEAPQAMPTPANEVLAQVTKDRFKLEILGASVLHTPRSDQVSFNIWPYAGRLRVTNLSDKPVEIRFAEGSIGRFALDGKLFDEQGQAIFTFDGGPPAPPSASYKNESLKPGGSAIIEGRPHYILNAHSHARKSYEERRKANANVDSATRLRVDFHVSFSVVEDGKETGVDQVLPTKLTVLFDQ
jgi:hypothetical protein